MRYSAAAKGGIEGPRRSFQQGQWGRICTAHATRVKSDKLKGEGGTVMLNDEGAAVQLVSKSDSHCLVATTDTFATGRISSQ